MDDHYRALGLNNSATDQEIRRAYRVLARRYHPDLNPGGKSADRFRVIAQAYEILSDPTKRADYDRALDAAARGGQGRAGHATVGAATEALRRAQDRARQHHGRQSTTRPPNSSETASRPQAAPEPEDSIFGSLLKRFGRKSSPNTESSRPFVKPANRHNQVPGWEPREKGVQRISVIEVSVSLPEAVMGTKKTVEVPDSEKPRKISVSIPAGVRSGSVVRMRAKQFPGEELVLIVRVASHPFLTLHPRGLVAEIPITVLEAIGGAKITVPTLTDPLEFIVPPGSRSGSEILLPGRGGTTRDGQSADLFVRLVVQVPDSAHAAGLKERAEAIEPYYGSSVRSTLPKKLLE
jgi:curved DNA-binding protein